MCTSSSRLLFVSLTLLSGTLLGCASTPPLTRDQWLEMSRHTFPSTTVDQVLRTGDEVLRLADRSDITIQHQPERMTASRKYLFYAVIAADVGSFNFDLSARQIGEDVEAYLYIGHSATPIMPVVTQTPGVQGGWHGTGVTAVTGVNVGRPIESKEAYELYFLRIESLLYERPWVTCKDAKSLFRNRRVGGLDSLCFLADDIDPHYQPPADAVSIDSKLQP